VYRVGGVVFAGARLVGQRAEGGAAASAEYRRNRGQDGLGVVGAWAWESCLLRTTVFPCEDRGVLSVGEQGGRTIAPRPRDPLRGRTFHHFRLCAEFGHWTVSLCPGAIGGWAGPTRPRAVSNCASLGQFHCHFELFAGPCRRVGSWTWHIPPFLSEGVGLIAHRRSRTKFLLQRTIGPGAREVRVPSPHSILQVFQSISLSYLLRIQFGLRPASLHSKYRPQFIGPWPWISLRKGILPILVSERTESDSRTVAWLFPDLVGARSRSGHGFCGLFRLAREGIGRRRKELHAYNGKTQISLLYSRRSN